LAVTDPYAPRMRGGILLRAALALMVGISLVTIGTTAATAATTGRYRTQPAGMTPALVDLGLSVTVAAGDTQLVTAHGTITVLAGTSLRTLSAPTGSSAQTWQPNQALVNTSYAAAPVQFTPDEEANTIQAFGDVNVTVCYYGSTGTCLGAGSRRSTTRAYVGTQLVVNQLQSDGTVCSTFVNGPALGTSITSTIHHYKINTSITDIPVSSSCTSRTFQASVRVTASAGYNSIIVEPNHQSQTSLYVRP
jgi:hypothetical protein